MSNNYDHPVAKREAGGKRAGVTHTSLATNNGQA